MAKRRTKPPKAEPKWRTVERVVGLLEANLDPGATVEHDVDPPDLEAPGHTRQCDVVVTTGPPHRRTRSIVEVQRRSRSVEIGAFDGWVAKMRAVGAQHLICVSTKGFPASVRAKAARLGPTIRLVTLKELEKDSPLFQGSLGRFTVRHAGTKDYPSVELIVEDPAFLSLPPGNILQHEQNFRTLRGETLSLNQIAQRLLNQDSRVSFLPNGSHQLEFETADSFVYLRNEATGPVRLRFTVTVSVHTARFMCDVLSTFSRQRKALSHGLSSAKRRDPKPLTSIGSS